jgi:hypothetical protein
VKEKKIPHKGDCCFCNFGAGSSSCLMHLVCFHVHVRFDLAYLQLPP